jgi:hypothetical protein
MDHQFKHQQQIKMFKTVSILHFFKYNFIIVFQYYLVFVK